MSATRRELLAKLLRDAGDHGVTTGELLQHGVGSRYSARLMELREQGWVVQAERVRDGQWRYILVSEPSSVASVPARPDGQPPSSPDPQSGTGARSLFDTSSFGAPRSAVFDCDDAA